MRHRHESSVGIVVVGGGVAGLSIAVRLAQADFPVTVLEASRLGFGASTRNQGWLHSGAWFAPDQPELARLCYESFHQTLAFCPECLEHHTGSMVYLAADPATDLGRWTAAWDAAGIPWEELSRRTVSERFPGLVRSPSRPAFELPDRAMRTDLLLRRLALFAEDAGVDIRVDTPVSRLMEHDGAVCGVETSRGETIPARLVILAGNARGGALFPGFGAEAVGPQSDVALVVLKTHLAAVRPQVSRWPLCVVDAEGFNHIPHRPSSVFGSNRWLPVHHAGDEEPIADEVACLWRRVHQFFPDVRREKHLIREWAGNTVQAMGVDQMECGRAPLPTVVDHARESPALDNLLSVFPGRASLWPHLAEQTRKVVLERLAPIETSVAAPPWETWVEGAPLPAAIPSPSANVQLYHCQHCGHVAAREPDLPPPVCCDAAMVEAAESAPRSRDAAKP